MYLTAAPAVLAIAATLPEGLNLPLAGASAVVFVPLSYFLSQIASDFGKRLEPALWKSWGGPPTTRFLRHDNDEFNPATRERVHERLRALGLDIPTTDQEKADRSRALDLYASAVDELRRLTRDTDRFPLVYKGNAEYGFRRNLLGLKTFGVTLTLAAIAGIGWAVLHEWRAAGVLARISHTSRLAVVGGRPDEPSRVAGPLWGEISGRHSRMRGGEAPGEGCARRWRIPAGRAGRPVPPPRGSGGSHGPGVAVSTRVIGRGRGRRRRRRDARSPWRL